MIACKFHIKNRSSKLLLNELTRVYTSHTFTYHQFLGTDAALALATAFDTPSLKHLFFSTLSILKSPLLASFIIFLTTKVSHQNDKPY